MRFALLALVACSAPAKPPLSHQTEKVEVAGCLPAGFEKAAIAELRADGDRATLCYQAVEERDGSFVARGYEPGDYRCFAIDERGAIAGEVPWQPPGPEPAKPAAHTIAWTTGSSYSVCTGATCATITTKHAPGPLSDAAIVSADGKRAFAMHARTGKNGQEIWGELVDVAGNRSLAELRVTDDDGSFADTGITRPVAVFGDKVAIGVFHAGPCCGTWLFDTRTGARTFLQAWDGAHVQIDATTLLVLPDDADHVASLVDLATSREVASLAFPGTGYGEAVELRSRAMLRLPHALVIAHAQPAGTAIFDPGKRTLVDRALPTCR